MCSIACLSFTYASLLDKSARLHALLGRETREDRRLPPENTTSMLDVHLESYLDREKLELCRFCIGPMPEHGPVR